MKSVPSPNDERALAAFSEQYSTAETYFQYWPSELSPAEKALRDQLRVFVSFGTMYYVYMLHRGIVCKAAPCAAELSREATPRQCFSNAALLAGQFPEDLVYFEGVAHSHIATAHAWCVSRKTGLVVDPTWEQPENCAYLGIPFDLDFVQRQVLERGFWGVFGEMPRREVLNAPIDEMVHPRWRQEIGARPKWPDLEAILAPSQYRAAA